MNEQKMSYVLNNNNKMKNVYTYIHTYIQSEKIEELLNRRSFLKHQMLNLEIVVSELGKEQARKNGLNFSQYVNELIRQDLLASLGYEKVILSENKSEVVEEKEGRLIKKRKRSSYTANILAMRKQLLEEKGQE